jgi:hypothetical protein
VNNNIGNIGINLLVFLLLFIASGFSICFCGFIKIKIQSRLMNNNQNQINRINAINAINAINEINAINNNNILLPNEQCIINYYTTLDLQNSSELPKYNEISNNTNNINNIVLPPNYNDIDNEAELTLPPKYNENE